MIRKKIESITGYISDKLFIEALQEATNDVKANRIAYKKTTRIDYIVVVMVIYIEMVRNQGLEKEKSPKLIA